MNAPGHDSAAPAPSALAEFLRALSSEDRVVVLPFDEKPVVVDDLAKAELLELHTASGGGLGGNAPAFESAAAEWAALSFYRACQFAVCRDVPSEVIALELAKTCPEPHRPSVDFSVDLVFRHLPELFDLARRTAPGDVLVAELQRLALAWPLSSVGIPVEGTVTLDSFADDPALWRLYIDRVAEYRAADRARDPRVVGQLRTDAGVFAEFDPFNVRSTPDPVA